MDKWTNTQEWYARKYHSKQICNIKVLPFLAIGEEFIENMMTSSNGNIFRVTGPLCGEFTCPRWIPHTHRPVTRSFDVDLRLNQPELALYITLYDFCTVEKKDITHHVDELNFGMISEQQDSKYYLCYDRNRN